jgi:hypothetical protein
MEDVEDRPSNAPFSILVNEAGSARVAMEFASWNA